MSLMPAPSRSRFEEVFSRRNAWDSSSSTYSDGAFHVDLYPTRGSAPSARISFPEVLFVRVSDEGIRLRLINSWAEAPEGMVVSDLESDLLVWLEDELLQTRDLSGVRHYVVTAGEEIIDVVSAAAPIWIELMS